MQLTIASQLQGTFYILGLGGGESRTYPQLCSADMQYLAEPLAKRAAGGCAIYFSLLAKGFRKIWSVGA